MTDSMAREFCRVHWRDPAKTNEYAQTVENIKPDLVVAAPTLDIGDESVVFEYIKEELKTPVVMVWLESAPNVVKFADMYAPRSTLTIFVDTKDHWRQFTRYPEICHWLPEPKDPRIFNTDRALSRDIPVSFIGSLVDRYDRAYSVAHCWAPPPPEKGVDIVKMGGLDSGAGATMNDYADSLRRSFITLNFTNAISFQQIKGRTAEAPMCGAMLLESESPETERLMDPWVHYLPFREPFHNVADDESRYHVVQQDSDLVDKLRYLLGPGRKEAEAIAKRGHRRAMEIFDGRKFWADLFTLVDEYR